MNRRRVPSAAEAPISQEDAAGLVPAEVFNAPQQTAAAIPSPVAAIYPPKIAASIVKITRDIGRIVKDGENKHFGYTYAKWSDILDKLAPMIATEGLIIIPSELQHNFMEAISTIAITYEFTIVNEDGDVWPLKPKQTQICMVKNNKGVIDDKAASKCFTQAQKYMMLALFKIRTSDVADADASDDGSRRTGKRVVPSSTGKTPPHAIAIVDGETPAQWAARFIAAISKADTQTEIDEWDRLNDDIIRKVQGRDVSTYNTLVDAMTTRQEAIKPKPQSKTINNEQAAEQTKDAYTDDERDWLHGLGGAFSGCEGIEELDIEKERLMEAQRGKVSQPAWLAAIDLYDEHKDRIEASHD